MQGLLPRLADGELDLAVVNEHPVLPETASPVLGRAYLFDDAFQVILPRGHKLARSGAAIDLPDLAGEVWVAGGSGHLRHDLPGDQLDLALLITHRPEMHPLAARTGIPRQQLRALSRRADADPATKLRRVPSDQRTHDAGQDTVGI